LGKVAPKQPLGKVAPNNNNLWERLRQTTTTFGKGCAKQPQPLGKAS